MRHPHHRLLRARRNRPSCRTSEKRDEPPPPCSDCHETLTPPRRPYIRFLFVGSELRLRLPSHPASRRRSCLRLAIPITRARRGLPPPASTPCLAHRRQCPRQVRGHCSLEAHCP